MVRDSCRLFAVSSWKEFYKHGSAKPGIAERSSRSIHKMYPNVDPARTHVDLSDNEEKLIETDNVFLQTMPINEN